jgi:hypothetical protein
MRTTVIVQGMILLTASAYTLKLDNNAEIYYWLAVIFGFLLTAVLYVQQKNYLADFLSHLEHIEKLELLIESNEHARPWTEYKNQRDKRKKEWLFFDQLVVSGPFFFFMAVFLFLAILRSCDVLPRIVEQAASSASNSEQTSTPPSGKQVSNKPAQQMQ